MENENLPLLVKSLEESFHDSNLEVIFIDDNSPDGTAQSLKELTTTYDNIKFLVRPYKMGLGSAYKDGFKDASGEIIIEMDADLSHNPKELPKLLKALSQADIVIGSRYIKGGHIYGWKWHRKLISCVANSLAKLILGLKIRDTTSGFRVYKRKAFEKIASESAFDGFEFQVEALYIAKRFQFMTAEVPITFKGRIMGKSKIKLKDIINFLRLILKMRLSMKRNNL